MGKYVVEHKNFGGVKGLYVMFWGFFWKKVEKKLLKYLVGIGFL